MDNGDVENGREESNFPVPIGRKYRPVVDDDSAVLEMSSMDPSGSSSSSSVPVHKAPLKYVLVSRTFSLLLIVYECKLCERFGFEWRVLWC